MLFLFVGSGCSALIYEVVWFHLLQLVIGASAVSLAALLASFMGGMCLGSVGLPFLIAPQRHPMRVYAYLELGIGAIGIALLVLLPYVQLLYVEVVGYGYAGILLRGLVGAVCLLPPTILMGGTLPAISRWIRTKTPEGVSTLGFFYGANIAGAVLGTVAASFYLLRLYDTVVATYVAATLNVTVAAVALVLARRHPFDLPAPSAPRGPRPRASSLVYGTIALSGMTALGAEVVWTRQLSLLFGATVYTFSLVLAVFLGGLGIGSGVGSVVAGRVRRPSLALGWCQLLLVVAIPYAAYMITQRIPFWGPTDDFVPWVRERRMLIYMWDMLRCAVAMLPAAALWGASFPLALAAASPRSRDPGHLVGGIYAVNTAGALVGALLPTLVIMPYLGSQKAQQGLTVLAALAAGLMFWFALFSRGAGTSEADAEAPAHGRRSGLRAGLVGILVVGSVVVMVRVVPPIPGGLIAYGREVADWPFIESFLYVEEGVSATVAVTDSADNLRQLHISGKVVASTMPIDMRIQRMLGHVPALAHPRPRSVLVVGAGAGVTAGAFVVYPEVERIVICEIEPRVPVGAREFFAEENYRVLDDPRTEVIYDDARHFLATTGETFDIITSDPIHPWMRGAAALYSSEYFELGKQHLNPGGILVQWVPLYETDEAAVKSQLATFMQAFPDATLWNSDIFGGGYDLVVLGQLGGARINVADVDARIQSNPALQESLSEIALTSTVDLLRTYAGRGQDLMPWLEGAAINRDRSLRLQYLAGLALDEYRSDQIYSAIEEYRRYPESLFVEPGELEAELRLYYSR